ncbi:MAG: exodeoxyribonuclease VII small subunit [Bacteroidales bacterium]|nr:exodeoxyribonuclease VII small subunit [Bacteroidales bacterium]
MPKKTLTYEQAMTELETIVSAVENGELEIDQLTTQIKRAQELLAHCKAQLNQVKTDVQSLLADEQK